MSRPAVSAGHAAEVASGGRFEFGANWTLFLELLNDDRIRAAEESLRKMLSCQTLEGKRFIDIGSGSGLFSLAARRLGAKVHSLDFDPKSVACTRELRRRYFANDPDWIVEEASVLDTGHLAKIEPGDILYSWGVLHHTGSMWQALANVAPLVKPNGQLFVAIYNDQGTASRRWTAVKKFYNQLPGPLRFLVTWPCAFLLYWRPVVKGLLKGDPAKVFREYPNTGRGMTVWRDLIDWVGGYPFEVAMPEEIFDFYRARGFTLEKLTTQRGTMGCCEFVFRRS